MEDGEVDGSFGFSTGYAKTPEATRQSGPMRIGGIKIAEFEGFISGNPMTPMGSFSFYPVIYRTRYGLTACRANGAGLRPKNYFPDEKFPVFIAGGVTDTRTTLLVQSLTASWVCRSSG
jgi:hypothetical protein